MRKSFFFTLIIAIAALFHACDNVEFSTDGNLYGYWHLASVDTLATQRSTDMSSQRIFWSVESRLVALCDRDGVYPEVVCEFERVGDSLIFHAPYFSNRNEGDILVDDVQAQPDALVADERAVAGDQLVDLVLGPAAEGTAYPFVLRISHISYLL